jgi:iron complex outermembrane receptor protein
MQLRRKVLSLSIVAALSVAGTAAAQAAITAQPPAAQQEATDLDTVVVKGIRGAIEQSLESKRGDTRVE